MISYERIKQDTPLAAKFLQLWAYLDHQDVWYELLSRGRHNFYEHSWFRELIKSEISFKEIMRTLLAYSLIESHELIESYSIHPVVHDWCTELISRGQEDNIILASTIIGSAVPSQSEPEYWLTQQRLLRRGERYRERAVAVALYGQSCCRYGMMYLSSSGLRSNYEGESRIHVCALAKPLVSPGCLPHFPTKVSSIHHLMFSS